MIVRRGRLWFVGGLITGITYSAVELNLQGVRRPGWKTAGRSRAEAIAAASELEAIRNGWVETRRKERLRDRRRRKSGIR